MPLTLLVYEEDPSTIKKENSYLITLKIENFISFKIISYAVYGKHLFANKKSTGEERMSLMKILFLLLLPFKFLLCMKLLLLCGL